MEFCTITPTRGDRPEFLEFCKHQLNRMIVKPTDCYFIEFPPCNKPDLVERLQYGINLAKRDGFKYAYIIEDDDYYPKDYFQKMSFNGYDLVGDTRTTYYHIGCNGYSEQIHPGRASLFTTGLNLDCIKDFRWPNNMFIDLPLWEHARRKGFQRRYADSGAVGIKHGVGMPGGKGHKKNLYKQFDNNWEYLSSLVDSEALQFYKDMSKKLNGAILETNTLIL